MHLMVVNFQLQGMTDAEFVRACEGPVAELFRGVPGLISKTWLRSVETNTYGGVYVWEDRAAMVRYQESELARSVAANPHFVNVTVRDFGVMEVPTRMTNGMVRAA